MTDWVVTVYRPDPADASKPAVKDLAEYYYDCDYPESAERDLQENLQDGWFVKVRMLPDRKKKAGWQIFKVRKP